MPESISAAVPLSETDFSTLVRLAPLISIDLVIRDRSGNVLLGMRANEPARGFYFVPGGRILKNEPVRDAFARILKSETGCPGTIDDARFLGVYDHIYSTNRFGDAGFGTHYVVLAYALQLDGQAAPQLDSQHSQFVWWSDTEISASASVHPYTKAYISR